MKSGPTWSKVPREAFEDDRLTKLQLRVLGILASHVDGKGFCTRRQEAIAGETGVKRESVNRAIGRLVALGYVERIRRAGMKRSLRYRVLIADGARGQLSLFDHEETRREAKAADARHFKETDENDIVGKTSRAFEEHGLESRCDRDVTTDVTHRITSVVTPAVTAINEQPPVNRSYADRASARTEDRPPGDAARPAAANDPGPTGFDGAGDLDRLEAQLREAGGDALDATSPGLLVLTEPISWLAGGCDLELDILPTVRGLAARARASPGGTVRTIRAWRYFREAVFEAKARRLMPTDVSMTARGGARQNVIPIQRGDRHANAADRRAAEREARRAAFAEYE